MTWEEALQIVKEKHKRYEKLCADDHPDKEFWRADVIKKAMNEHHIVDGNEPTMTKIKPQQCEENVEPPSVFNQIKSASTAAFNFALGGFKTTSKETQEERLKICGECDHFKNGKCGICGCHMKWKLALETKCPIGKW